MEDNVCWNRLGERILRTAVVRYLVMNLRRLRHSALMASAPEIFSVRDAFDGTPSAASQDFE